MKRNSFVFIVLLLFLFTLPVFAEENKLNAIEQSTQQNADKSKSLPKPVSVDRKNQDGNEYIIKTYEVAIGFDPSLLIENGFEQDGFLFAHLSTEMKENEMYADPSYVPQTAVKDGHTLPLVNVNWTVMGTGLAGDTLIPTEYKATASYSKNVSSKVASSYITTANYAGTVTKSSINTVFYTLTYVGTPIYIQPNEEQNEEQVETNSSKSSVIWWTLGGVMITLIIAGGGTVLFFVVLKNRNSVQVYNLIDKEYINIGKQIIDVQNPVVDLNEFKDLLQSNSFAFVLDKPLTKKLYGRNIAVTLDDVTVKHMVKGYNEQYRFNLEFGGVLDVE